VITFTYTPLGSTGAVTLALLDSDRYWPAEWGHESQGNLQLSLPTRANSQSVFARGNAIVPIKFTTYRVFANRATAWRHAFIDVPKANGQVGTLYITIPGGGSFRSVNCGCQSSPSRCTDVGVQTTWTFIGPQLSL
jgi:hypothetical protein